MMLKLMIVSRAKINMPIFFFCAQCLGDCGPAGRWSVSTPDLPVDASAEARPFHASSAEAAGGADEDHGQCGHLLHAAHALYLYLQVCHHAHNNRKTVVCLPPPPLHYLVTQKKTTIETPITKQAAN